MGLFDGFFKKPKDTTISQEALMTDEQKQAMQLLMNFGQTGRLGEFQAGQQYTGPLGDFTPTAAESLSSNKLMDLLQSALPGGLDEAASTFSRIAKQGFDPNDPQFKAYKTAALRAGGESADILNRDASSAGAYFSSGLNKEKGLLAERTQQDLTGKLADLFNTAQTRALGAAEGLSNVTQAKENLQNNRLAMGFDMGSLERLLKNAEAQSQYAEWQRSRNERLGTIDSISNVLNKNVNYGVKSVTLPGGNSPFENLMGNMLQAGLTAAGAAVGGPIGASIGNSIGGSIKGSGGGTTAGAGAGGGANSGIFATLSQMFGKLPGF